MRTAAEMRQNREGFALVTTLMVVVVLTMVALAAVMISGTEKKTSFAEQVHTTAVFAADAGGETAINFLRLSDLPPSIIDFTDFTVQSEDDRPVQGSQEFDYDCHYVRKRPKPGWGVEYLDYDYRVASSGRASRQGRSDVELVASRLFKEGY